MLESTVHISAVHQKLKTDPLAQTARADPKTGQLDAGHSRWRVFAMKNRFRRVGWRVSFSKTR